MASDPLGFLIEQHHRLGPIFRVRAGHMKLVVMAGERANAFAHGEGADCLSSRETLAPTLREFGAPNNFVGLDGDPHRLLRKRFASHFSRKAAETKLPALIDLTLSAFAEHSSGDEIPFVAFSQALASRQVGTLLVGRVPSRDQHEAILRYTNAVVVNLSLRRMPRWVFRLSQGRQLRRDRRTSFAFARELVERRIHEGCSEPSNFVLASLASHGVPVSVDSPDPEVQRFAAGNGATMINDVRGFPTPDVAAECAAAGCDLVVMHSVRPADRASRVDTAPEPAVASAYAFFSSRLDSLDRSGVPRNRIILDPGMGYFLGSSPGPSIAVLRELGALRNRFARPLMISVSRKSFVQRLTGRRASESGSGSLAAELFAIGQGARYVRTHEVKALRDALAVLEALASEADASGLP
jgi:dihydropteroate synthase